MGLGHLETEVSEAAYRSRLRPIRRPATGGNRRRADPLFARLVRDALRRNASQNNNVGIPAQSAEDSLLLKIETAKIVDLIVAKQTHFYSLWAVYTAVQFTAGSYGMGQSISFTAAIAVLAGVWAFNFGHLGFVLQCITQLTALRDVLKAAATNDKVAYEEALKQAINQMEEGGIFLRYYLRKDQKSSYFMNSFVHFFIDTCASIALLIRVDNPWLKAYLVHWG